MSKLTTYTILMTGFMLLFYFTGLLQECDQDGLCKNTTPNSQLLNLALHPSSIKDMALGQKVVLVLGGVGAAAALVTAAFISNIRLAVLGSFAVYYFNLGWDFLAVYRKVYQVNPVIAVLLFSPFLIMFCIAVIDWWGGTG